MKEHPLLCNSQVARAIRDGLQTQDRRPITQAIRLGYDPCDDGIGILFWTGQIKAPWQIGDHLWVRETFATAPKPGKPDLVPREQTADTHFAVYRADFEPEYKASWRWRPSIHMPRWASKTTVEVLKIRVERVQEITAFDAIEEGIDPAPHRMPDSSFDDTAIDEFREFWNSIYAKRGLGWDPNPWVRVTEFRLVS